MCSSSGGQNCITQPLVSSHPPGNIPGIHFCYRLSQPQGHIAAGKIMSMKNFNETIGNRTRNLPACSAIPQPTAPSSTPVLTLVQTKQIRMNIHKQNNTKNIINHTKKINKSIHITKTPAHYKTHTYTHTLTHPHVHTPIH